jgi:hypothetical protein
MERHGQWIGGNFEAYDEKLFSSNFLRLMDLGEDEEMTDLPDKTYLRSEHHAYVLIFINSKEKCGLESGYEYGTKDYFRWNQQRRMRA